MAIDGHITAMAIDGTITVTAIGPITVGITAGDGPTIAVGAIRRSRMKPRREACPRRGSRSNKRAGLLKASSKKISTKQPVPNSYKSQQIFLAERTGGK